LSNYPVNNIKAVHYGSLSRSKLLLLCCFCLLMRSVYSQSVRCILKDKITGQAVSFAQIRIDPLNGNKVEQLLAGKDGVVESKSKPPFILTVTCLGYKSMSDTITTGNNDTIRLSPDFYELDRVVVTGQFHPQVADKSIYNIDVIDNRQISLKAANDLGDLMRNNPDFQYRSEGILGDFIRIRGLTGEHVKILIDNMPVTGRLDDNIELGQLSLSTIDHVEVIEGPMSVIYGSNALAGAINLITTDYSKRDLIASLNSYYETVGVYDFDGTFSRRFGKQTFTLSAGRNFHAGWGPVDTSRYKIWKPKLQYQVAEAYNLRTNNLSLRYTSDYLNEELRDLGPLTLENLYEKALDGYHYTTRWNNSLNMIEKLGDHFALNLQSGYSYYQKRKITYLNDLVNLRKTIVDDPSLQDTTRFHLVTVRSFITHQTRKTEFQTGIDYSLEIAEGKRTKGKQSISDIAGFMNVIYRPFDGFSLQPGIRVMHNSKFNAPIIYAFNIKYKPGNFTFRTSYAKGFNAPSLKQLYLEFIDNNHEIYGNPALHPETGDSYNLSSDYTINSHKTCFTTRSAMLSNWQLILPARAGGHILTLWETVLKQRELN
jgi:outer membrane receptor for ferrienterochelin and colicins